MYRTSSPSLRHFLHELGGTTKKISGDIQTERVCRASPRHAPGNEHGHLASAVVGELYEEVSRLLTDVPVEHGDLQQVGQRGLVVKGEVEPHCALARVRALRFQHGRKNKLPSAVRNMARRRFAISSGFARNHALPYIVWLFGATKSEWTLLVLLAWRTQCECEGQDSMELGRACSLHEKNAFSSFDVSASQRSASMMVCCHRQPSFPPFLR